MKRTLPIAFLLAAAAEPALPACNNSSLKGAYALSGSGSIVLPPNTPITGPFVRAGLMAFDGTGGLKVSTIASYNGYVTQEPFSGTYTVQTDCSFTIKATVPDPINLPAVFTGLISGNGDQLDLFLTDPQGTTIGASLIRQPKGNCQTRDLFGTYTLRASGSILAPNPSAGPFSRLGTFTATGDTSIFATPRNTPGAFTFAGSTSYNGVVRNETFSGTFTVKPDCTAHFEYTQPSPSGNVTTTFDGMLADEDKQVVYIMTAPGAVISGSMTRQ